jgi:ferrochelatase
MVGITHWVRERMAHPYDAFLLLSFGGPEGPDDVMPFLRNASGGRGVPEQRLAEVAEHYLHFGGVSPINAQCRALLDAIGAEFAAHGLNTPLYWGNRNWRPYLTDTLAQMRDDGVRHALAFVTSPYGSYSSCRQYLEDIDRARAQVGAGAPEMDKLRQYHDHPGFIEPLADAARAALAQVPEGLRARTRLVFTAHSVPLAMAEASGAASQGGVGARFEAQLREVASLVAARAGTAALGSSPAAAPQASPLLGSSPAAAPQASPLLGSSPAAAPQASPPWDLVWQSRSGPPQVPWLAPDINDHLAALHEAGTPSVVVCPIGFISDHMEVVWDLDNQAAQTARRLGMHFVRAATPGTDPRFVTMIRELVLERIDPTAPRRGLGSLRTWDVCEVACCLPGRPNPVTTA